MDVQLRDQVKGDVRQAVNPAIAVAHRVDVDEGEGQGKANAGVSRRTVYNRLPSKEALTVRIRVAVDDGRLKTNDPVFASMQLEEFVKGFAQEGAGPFARRQS